MRWLTRTGVLVAGLGLLACGTPNAARREEVDALRKEMRDQRERQQVLERRLADMDSRMALLSDKVSRGGASPVADGALPSFGRPALGVVKVAPRQAPRPAQVVDQDEGEADVQIRNVDENGEGLRLGVDRQVLAVRRAPGNGPEPEGALAAQEEEVVAKTDPKTQYNLAMRRYKGRQYSEAARGFEEVADRWPDHPLADNAIYWTGVCYLAQGEMALAINELQKVPVRYPRSDKVPDALFQLAEAYQRVGDKESARAMLTQVVEMYPGAEAAGPARDHLAKMNRP
jgi:tol-pal system protein YbgF